MADRSPLNSAGESVPVDVGTAVQLWWGVIVFGLINMAGAMVTLYDQRGDLAEEFRTTYEQADAAAPAADIEGLIVAGIGMVGAVALVIAGLLVLVVRKMESGRNWARVTLTVIGAMQGVGAVSSLFGLASPDSAAALVTGASGIVQGVLAVGAIVLLHRKESNEYFLRARSPRKHSTG